MKRRIYPLAFSELQNKCLELLDKTNKLSELKTAIPVLEEKITALTGSISNDSARKNELASQTDDLRKNLNRLWKSSVSN